MSLDPNFALTPRNSYLYSSADEQARLYVHGVSLFPNYSGPYRYSFDHQHQDDEVFFWGSNAADPTADYTGFQTRKLARYVELFFDFSALGTNKELALVFGFDATIESRVLVFSDGGQLGNVTLFPGDNQFLMEVESIDFMYLYFIHVHRNGLSTGGNWFFRGVTGYVI